MVLFPSCLSVLVILVCLALVCHTVRQQRNIVRAQQSRLSRLEESSGAGLPASLALQQTSTLRGSQFFSHSEQIARPTTTSSLDRLTNESIGQCLLSGCSFINFGQTSHVESPSHRTHLCAMFVGCVDYFRSLFAAGIVALPCIRSSFTKSKFVAPHSHDYISSIARLL
jgi:hypothetical protein